MASYTVNFTDGSSHTYDNVPETVTEDQVRARANDDYADKEVDHIAGGMPTPSATSANPELGPSIAEKGAAAAQTVAGPVLHALHNPVVDIGLGGAAAYKVGTSLMDRFKGQPAPVAPTGNAPQGPVAPMANEMGVAQYTADNMTPQQMAATLKSPNMTPQGPAPQPMTSTQQILSKTVSPYNAQAVQQAAQAAATGGPAAGQATNFIQRINQLAERYTPAIQRMGLKGGNFLAPAAALYSGLTSHQQLPSDPYEQARVIQQNSMPGMSPEQVRNFQNDFEKMFTPKKKQ